MLVEFPGFFSCFLGCFVDKARVDTCEDASERWSEDVSGVVVQRGQRGIWVDGLVEQLLENRLDEADGWVDGTATEAGSDHDGGVQTDSGGNSIDWHVLGSVVFDNREDGGHIQKRHEYFDPEDLGDVLAPIVAALGWTQLSDIVSGRLW